MEFTAKISSGDGNLFYSQVIRQSVPAASIAPAAAASSLDKAFEAAVSELVVWTSTAIKAHHETVPAVASGFSRRGKNASSDLDQTSLPTTVY